MGWETSWELAARRYPFLQGSATGNSGQFITLLALTSPFGRQVGSFSPPCTVHPRTVMPPPGMRLQMFAQPSPGWSVRVLLPGFWGEGSGSCVEVASPSRCSTPFVTVVMAPSRVPACVPFPRRSSGALWGRPSLYAHPNVLSSVSTPDALVRCLVKRSAGFSTPLTLRSSIAPDRMCCCSHNACVSMWRNLPSPVLWQIPIVAVESVQTLNGHSTPKSWSRL